MTDFECRFWKAEIIPFLGNWNWLCDFTTTSIFRNRPIIVRKGWKGFQNLFVKNDFDFCYTIFFSNKMLILFALFLLTRPAKENYYWMLCFFWLPHKLFNWPSFRIVDSSAIYCFWYSCIKLFNIGKDWNGSNHLTTWIHIQITLRRFVPRGLSVSQTLLGW